MTRLVCDLPTWGASHPTSAQSLDQEVLTLVERAFPEAGVVEHRSAGW